MIRLLLSYLTFPGVIIHEYAHARACHWLGIRVINVCYLRFGNPLGYVIHERPAYTIHHILVAVAPFFISTATALTISALACCFFATTRFTEFQDSMVVMFVWLAFSIALHAFPSSGDADSLWDDVRSSRIGLLPKLMLVPVVALIRLTGLGARLWLDVLFAIIVVALPPLILLSYYA